MTAYPLLILLLDDTFLDCDGFRYSLEFRGKQRWLLLQNGYSAHVRLWDRLIEECRGIGFLDELGLFVFDVVFIEHLDLPDYTL